MLAKLKQYIRWSSTTFTINYYRLIGSILLLIFRQTEINAAPTKKELTQIETKTAAASTCQTALVFGPSEHAYISSVTIFTVFHICLVRIRPILDLFLAGRFKAVFDFNLPASDS